VLHWVCALGDLTKANAVLSIPGVDVNLQDNAGWTSLMIAGNTHNIHNELQSLLERKILSRDF
jgi:hypothetical protein